MTGVCVRCGWIVFDARHCRRCKGPAISYQAAAKGCGVANLHQLLHIPPERRVLSFRLARKGKR